MKYLFDTDWIIDGLKGKRDAVGALRSLGSEGAAVSVISLAELFEGAYGTADPVRELTRARRFLRGFKILDVTRPIAEHFAQQRASLRRHGRLITDFDLLIAATALTHHLNYCHS
jgi:tRNA(fMet)-specific endonuclease VapC